MKSWLLLLTVITSTCYGQIQYLPLTKLEKVSPPHSEASLEKTSPFQPRWSPKSEHHKAVVRVSCPDGAGTGVKIKHTGKGLIVLTNRHVVRQGDQQGNPVFREVNIRAYNGNTVRMRVVATSIEKDLALLHSVDPEIWTNYALPLGNFEVPLGADIELVGYGGPSGNTLRHVYGERLAKVSINAITISGDSGSPLIYGGSVVGINYGGRDVVGASQGWKLIYPASSFVSGPQLCQWVNDQCYGQLQCQPYVIQQPIPQGSPSRPQGGYQMYPPSTPQVSPSQPVSPAPPPPIDGGPPSQTPASPSTPSTPEVDEDAIVDRVVEKVLGHPQLQPANLQGPPGKDGKDGRDGEDGYSPDMQAMLEEFRKNILSEVQQIVDSSQNEPVNVEDIANEVMQRIPMCECKPEEPPTGSSGGLGDKDIPPSGSNGKYLESNRVLYFTADSCTSCFEVTNLVNSLKRSGYPITIITLTTSMAEAHQVPQIFVPSTGKRALGPSNVKEFLSQIQL